MSDSTRQGPAHKPASLRIQAQAWEAMLAHLGRVPHREACGLLSGTEAFASHFHAIPNIAAAPESRYEMEPAALIRTLCRLRETGARLFAVVHSHPNGVAWPSATDIAEASYPEAVYIIVALRAAEPKVRGFWLRPDREPEPLRLEIVDT